MFQSFPLYDILTAQFIFDDYKPNLIAEMTNLLSIENCIIIVTSRKFESKANLREKFYGTQYGIETIDRKLVEKLKKPGLNEKFTFPEMNELIPTEFGLVPDEKSNIPEVLIKNNLMSVWFSKDNIFHKPKVHCMFKLIKLVPIFGYLEIF